MKAYVLHGIGEYRLESLKEPVPAENEALVAVKAVGICGSDIPRIYETGAYSHPLIPGHEFSGVVVETGADVDAAWKGKRVGVYPLIPCRTCVPCMKKQYEMCQSYSYIGSRRNGAFAEYVTVPAANLIELPDRVSFEVAAMLEPMAVAVHAMRQIRMDKSLTATVCGLGTIGLLLVMFLKEAGFENIFVVGNKELQWQKAMELAISKDEYCDAAEQPLEKLLMEKTAGKGVDVFFECVGRNETIAQAMKCTSSGGQVVLVGNPHSNIELDKGTYWNILRRQFAVYGTWNSSFTGDEDDDWHYVLERLQNGRINPSVLISHRFGIDDFMYGFDLMREKKEGYIKVMALI